MAFQDSLQKKTNSCFPMKPLSFVIRLFTREIAHLTILIRQFLIFFSCEIIRLAIFTRKIVPGLSTHVKKLDEFAREHLRKCTR